LPGATPTEKLRSCCSFRMAEAEAPTLPGGTAAEWRAMVRRDPKEANIGPGRKYPNRAKYEADVAEWKREKAVRDALAPAREKALAALRESRRAPRPERDRDRGGLLPSGAAGREKRKAASRSGLAKDFEERGCPELADIVDADDDCAEYETLMEWAAGEGLDTDNLTDKHVRQWRLSENYREFKMENAVRVEMCKLEIAAFESWAASHGGLKGSRGRTPWAHLAHMHSM